MAEIVKYDPEASLKRQLQIFLNNFEDVSHKDAVAQISHIRTRIMDRFPRGAEIPETPQIINKLISSVESFLNREWMKHFAWTLNLYKKPTEDIEDMYDHEGYQSLKKIRLEVIKNWIQTKEQKYKAERKEIEAQISKHPWTAFIKEVRVAHDNLIKIRDKHVLVQDELQLDSSKQSKELLDSFRNLVDVLKIYKGQ